MKIHKPCLSPWLGLVILASGVALGQQRPAWKGKIGQEGGITVIKNPEEPVYSGDALRFEVDLTVSSPEDEALGFQNLNYLAVDDAENIYVSDSKAGHILVFDKGGGFVRTIGKRGQGPGEMSWPLEIQILGNKELLVNDSGQAKAHVFALDGKFLRQMTTSKLPGFRLPKADSAGRLVAGHVVPGDPLKCVLIKVDSELKPICEVVSSVLNSRPPVVDFFEMRWRSNYVWNVASDDSIIWGNFRRYELFVCEPGGNCIKKIVRDYQGTPITNDGKQRLLKEFFGNNRAPREVTINFPDHYPPFVYLTCDDRGRIFALSYVTTGEDEQRTLDVFDPEGRYIIQTKTAAFPQVWKKGMMYSVGEDEEGFEVIRRYRLKWEAH